MNKIFLDLETTGLYVSKKDKIIEICCLKIFDSGFKEIFHYYLNPKKKINKEAFLIHGISNKFLYDKPIFKDIALEFIKFIRNSKIIIHNAKFDIKFLNFELKNLNFKKIYFYCYKIIDTLKLSKKIYKNKKNSLKALCKRLNIDDSKRIKHSAMIDVKLLYKIYLKLFEKVNIIKLEKIKFLKKKNISLLYNKIYKKSNNLEKSFNNFIIKKIIKSF